MKATPKLPASMHVFERGWLSSNNILFSDDQHALLVDSGYCTHARQTLSLIEARLGARPLDTLVNTHLHSDHCGGNAALQAQYPKLETLIPPGQAAQVACWDAVALTYLPTGQLCPRYGFDRTLQPGTSMQFGAAQWDIHAAPGHDPYSLLFFQPDHKILISADALWENGFGVVFPELEGGDAFNEVAATLDLIERLSPAIVVPGHGRVFNYSENTLALAAQRLDAFISNPRRHAHHAAKVLLKFKLLEIQAAGWDEFMKWALKTSYLVHIREKFFPETPTSEWITSLCDELVKSGAAGRDSARIYNA